MGFRLLSIRERAKKNPAARLAVHAASCLPGQSGRGTRSRAAAELRYSLPLFRAASVQISRQRASGSSATETVRSKIIVARRVNS